MRNKGITYLAMGDSITWMKQSFITLGSQFYATQIRNAIRTNHGPCQLLNKGIGGTTTARMITNLSWLSNLEPDVVTIGVGTNDCVNGPDVTTYQTNLGLIIDKLRLQNPNVKIILCSPPRTLDTNRQTTIQSYRDAMATVATNKNTLICHFENAWTSANDPTNIGSDNVHPTPAGQTALYNILWPIVQSAIATL